MRDEEKGCEDVGPFGENVKYEYYALPKLPDAKYLDVYLEIHKDRFVSVKSMVLSLGIAESFVRRAIKFAKRHYGLVHARKGNTWYWFRRSFMEAGTCS